MRKSDKIKNFKKVNLLTEQRYLHTKGLLKEFDGLEGMVDYGESTKSQAVRNVLGKFEEIKNGAMPKEVGIGLALQQLKSEVSYDEYQEMVEAYYDIIRSHGSHIGMDEGVLGISGSEIDIDGITDALVATTLHGGDDNTVYLRAKDSLADSNDQVKGEFYTMLANKMDANNLTNQARQYRSIAQQFRGELEESEDLINENNSLEKDYFMYEGEFYRPGKLLLEPKINDDSLEVKFGLEIKKFDVEKGSYWQPIGGQLIYYLRGKQTGNYENDKNLEDTLIFVDSRYQKKVDAKNFKMTWRDDAPLIDGIRFYVNTEITKIWK